MTTSGHDSTLEAFLRMGELPVGTTLFEKYEVLKLLGSGATGAVYLCRAGGVRESFVAIKLMPAAIANSKVAAQRINREIRSAFTIESPHVVRFYECVRDESYIGIVMEYVAGGSLEELIQKRELHTIDRVVDMLLGISSGLVAIHAVGIVHRDLKPANILLDLEGQPKIADLGLAFMLNAELVREAGLSALDSSVSITDFRRITAQNKVVGTPHYLSPEYVSTGEVDHRSDIYAAGVIAYELLTRRPPFRAESLRELMQMKIDKDPEPPNSVNPVCPRELSSLVVRMLKRDPEERIQTSSHLNRELRLLAQDFKAVPLVSIGSNRHWSGMETEVLTENQSLFERPAIFGSDGRGQSVLHRLWLSFQKLFASKLLSQLIYVALLVSVCACGWLLLSNHYNLQPGDFLPKIQINFEAARRLK